jgi:enoyl-[acyl-carrier-protein] reductase (NADH)
MTTVTLQYNNNNAVLNGILDAVAKMPDVKIIRPFIPSKAKAKSTTLSDEALYKLAEEIKATMNPNAPIITMDEIVQEVRDYRNGK